MSDDEYELLDELYFLQSFAYLKGVLSWEEEKLLANLQRLYEKGWIKCYSSPDEEIFVSPSIQESGKEYFYLATKKGLLSHTTL